MNAERARCIATVVAREAPVSAHLGDRAVIFADGRMEGFIGGACSRDIVRRHALAALESGRPLLVQIRPGGVTVETAADGSRVVIPMTCTSEGAVDVFLEPQLPARRFFIAGMTPVAEALAKIAAAAGFRVTRVVLRSEVRDLSDGEQGTAITLDDLQVVVAALEPGDRVRAAALVASQGHYDEDALVPFAGAIGYVGLVASRKRAAAIRAVLVARGVDEAALAAIANPAGLDLGARDALGVAVSILAEVVATSSKTLAPREDAIRVAVAIDPVCGMSVDQATARYAIEHDGSTVFFCCAGCREAFAASPGSYATAG